MSIRRENQKSKGNNQAQMTAKKTKNGRKRTLLPVHKVQANNFLFLDIKN